MRSYTEHAGRRVHPSQRLADILPWDHALQLQEHRQYELRRRQEQAPHPPLSTTVYIMCNDRQLDLDVTVAENGVRTGPRLLSVQDQEAGRDSTTIWQGVGSKADGRTTTGCWAPRRAGTHRLGVKAGRHRATRQLRPRRQVRGTTKATTPCRPDSMAKELWV